MNEPGPAASADHICQVCVVVRSTMDMFDRFTAKAYASMCHPTLSYLLARLILAFFQLRPHFGTDASVRSGSI